MSLRVAVLGNCQAQVLEGLFATCGHDLAVDALAPNFQMEARHADAVTAVLDKADIVFAHRVAADYHQCWLTPAELKLRHGAKVIIWPNIYFDGYTPGVHYLYLADWGKVGSPLEDYHLAEIADAYRRGDTATAAAARLMCQDNDPLDSFAASLTALRTREAEADVPISDFLADCVEGTRCVYTPNHPKSFVLAEMAGRLAARADFAFDKVKAVEAQSRLDRIYIPASPRVVRRHGLRFDRILVYRGVSIESVGAGAVRLGFARCYDALALAEAFYRVYDVALQVSQAGCRPGNTTVAP